jgi:hypothetical protein
LLLIGDFGLDRLGDPAYESMVRVGLWPPREIGSAPRTIFGDDPACHFIDHISWLTEVDKADAPPLTSLRYTGNGGHFHEFLGVIYPEHTRSALSWRISDHYPVFTEFETQ